jgi:undecaprenyl-diphosphatase
MGFLDGLDKGTLYFFQHHTLPWLDPVMVVLTHLGGGWVLTGLVVLAVIGLLRRRRYQAALYVVATTLSGALLVKGLKNLVGRERPDDFHPLAPAPEDLSFPSGHAMNSAIVYVTLALLAGEFLSRRSLRFLVVAASGVLILLIGTSRLYLSVHYLSDVIAGWLGGLAWALGCRWVWQRWRMRGREGPVAASR